MNPEEQIQITISCCDCDDIPKVHNAGKIVAENGAEIQIMHNGVKIIKDCYHKFITEIIQILKGHHEPQEERIFYEVLKQISKNGIMIELGSSWAYYSLWFNKEIPDAVNYLIEPNPGKLKNGIRNFELNNIKSGQFFGASIGKHYDETAVFIDWDKRKYQVPAFSIDYFIEKFSIDKIDILHSDVQGFEYEMLQGATNNLSKKKINYLFISTHSDEIHNKCLKYLREMDYHIIASHTIEESYAIDGLIVSSANKPVTQLSDLKISYRRNNVQKKYDTFINKIKYIFPRKKSKSYSQYKQDIICFKKYFSKLQSGTFLEIGADDGIDKSNTYLYELKGWKGMCVEPSKKRFKLLKENRKCICENYAIAENEETKKFMDISGWGKGLSGLVDEYDELHKKRIENELKHPMNKGHEITEVNTIPLRTLLKKHGFTHINFCTIDVEGGELAVLKSIDFSSCTFDVILVENNYGNNSIEDFLAEKGFLKKDKIEIDDVFVRKSFHK